MNKNASLLMPIALLGVVYMVLKSFGNRLTKDAGASEILEVETIGSTLTDHQAKSIADSLYQQMIYVFAYRGDRLVQILKDLTIHDYNHVYKVFGLRQYSNAWGNQGDPLSSDDYDLTYWLHAEMTEDNIDELNLLNPDLKIF